MKIMVPLSAIDNVTKFRQAGADEFYFGFEHQQWSKLFGNFSELNRMSSFGAKANVPFEELETIIKQIHDVGAHAYVAINSPSYSIEEIKFLQKLVEKIQQFEPDGLITGNIEMCVNLKQWCNIPVTAGTMCAIYNTEILSFYQKLGIKRVIIPRDIQLADLKSIVTSFPDIEFECFILRNGCRFSDANCLAFHSRAFGSLCSYINALPTTRINISETTPEKHRESQSNHFLYDRVFHYSACGLCEVDTFKDLHISSLKIVGRADKPDEIIKDISLLRHLIDHDGNSHSLIRDTCLYGLNCYYQQH